MTPEYGFAEFALLYEKMVDWDRRLARETPFYRQLFHKHNVKSVLDVACGPGRHAVEFASWGLRVTGADVDKGMLELAGVHARARGVEVRFVEADFLNVGEKVGERFDAIICVGNSLPALADSAARTQVLKGFAGLATESGIVVVHILNYDVLIKGIDGGASASVRTSTDGSVRFVKSFRRAGEHVELTVEYRSTAGASGRLVHELYPVNEPTLRGEMEGAGLVVLDTLGDYQGGGFDRGMSEDLIVVARKR